jgi:hypothetical protein
MKRIKIISIFYLILIPCLCLRSEILKQPLKIEAERMLVNDLIYEIAKMDIKSGEITANQKPLVIELQKIIESLPKNSKKSASELLSNSQAIKYGEILSKQKYFELQEMIVSARVRDLEFIKELIAYSTNKYLGTLAFVKSDNIEVTKSTIGVFDLMFENLDKLDQTPWVNDTIDFQIAALYDNILYEHIVSNVNEWAADIVRKYKLKSSDDIKLTQLTNEEDAKRSNLMAETKALMELSSELACTRALYTIMTIKYRCALLDVADSNGSFDSIGKTITKDSQNWNADTKTILGISNAIDNKIDSEWIKRSKKITNKTQNTH